MNPLELIQGTEEWLAYKAGRVSASHIVDVMAGGKGITRNKYMAKLIVERLTEAPVETYSSGSMEWGINTEPEARSAYCFFRSVEVVEVGFVDHPTLPLTGCSPDGLVGDNGLVEIKCPESHTHLETLLSEKIDPKYIKQMQFQMCVTHRAWCDFISFDPRFPEKNKLWVKRVERDEVMIKDMEIAVVKFNTELLEKIERLSK